MQTISELITALQEKIKEGVNLDCPITCDGVGIVVDIRYNPTGPEVKLITAWPRFNYSD